MPIDREHDDLQSKSARGCPVDRQPRPPARARAAGDGASAQVLPGKAPSEATASRMIRPWTAFSHCGCDWQEDQGRADRAEQERRRSGCRRACRVRPKMATPPTTTAAIACSSSPVPALGSTSASGRRFSRPARPASTPIATKTPKPPARAGCRPAGQPRGPSPWRTRPGRPRGSAGPRRTPGTRRRAITTDRATGPSLDRPEPLEPGGQVADELPLGPSAATRGRSPAWPASPRSTAARAPRPAAVDGPHAAPARASRAPTSGIGRPGRAASPRPRRRCRRLRADRDIDLPADDHQRHPDRRHQHGRPGLSCTRRSPVPPRRARHHTLATDNVVGDERESFTTARAGTGRTWKYLSCPS